MIRKGVMLLRLALGKFTPFISPYWGHEEYDTVRAWINGEDFPTAPEELRLTLQTALGEGWTIALVNLGRSAIQLALESIHLPVGSEVLLPSYACTGVVMPVYQSGLKPVFVDVDEHFNLSFESIMEADSPDVRAIILCHLSGCWARDTDRILEWAHNRGIIVIDDAAQVQGLEYEGRMAGTVGDVGIFSAHGGKAIVSSGGGWLITRNQEIAAEVQRRILPLESRQMVSKRVVDFCQRYGVSDSTAGRRLLRGMVYSKCIGTHSNPREDINDYRFQIFGMSDIEAKLILLQIPRLPEIIERRRRNAAKWAEMLIKAGLNRIMRLPSNHNIFVKMLLSSDERCRQELEILSREVLMSGVELEWSYVPLHMRRPFSTFRTASMKTTERYHQGAVSVPVRPNLGDEDWRRIQTAVTRAAEMVRYLQRHA